MAVLLILAFLVLSGRLFQIQILEGSKYAQKARRQQTQTVLLDSRRGKIVDRSGKELAVDLPRLYSLGVRPKQTTDPGRLCQELAAFTGRPVSHYRNRLNSPSKFVYLEWRLTPPQAERLTNLGIGGISLRKTSGRFYPYYRATSQVLGYTDVDGRGIAGLEVYCDSTLQGEKGWETHRRNARGASFWDPFRRYELPRDGGTVRLSIDIIAQEVLYNELTEVLQTYRADWAGGVLLNPKTGEILAICSVPDFDPLRPESGSQEDHRLRPVTDTFEPGSMLKILAATAALDKRVLSPRDSIDCENGAYRIGNRILRDVHKFDKLTFADVLVYSSNIGMAKVAEMIGSKELYRYALRYGFGCRTGVDYPGEAAGILRPYDSWKPIDLANIAIGQGISATMLQVALAFGAIANDGILMEPRLILNRTDADGVTVTYPPREVRRVMEPRTARLLQKILTDAVERGTGKNAALQGVKVAGKTGTAQLPNFTTGGYYRDRFVASFVGFLPADDADRVLIITVCDPKGAHFGSQVAAPVFKRVMQRLRPADAVRRSWRAAPLEVTAMSGSGDGKGVLPFFGNAWDWLKNRWLSDFGSGREDSSVDQALEVVPDVKGLSLREAVSRLSRCGVRVQVEGSGWVVRQSLKPGSELKADQVCVLTAEP